MLFRLLITIEFFRVTGFVSVLANNNNNDVIIDDNPYCRSNNQSFPRNPFHQTNNPASIASSRSKVEMFGEILKARAQELRRTPNRKVELVFLVDASASVGAEEFLNELKFVKKLLADFTVDRHSTRVSVITFSSKSRIIRHIDHLSHPRDDNHKCSLMEEELPKIEFSGGGTYTLGAVLEAQVRKRLGFMLRLDSSLYVWTDAVWKQIFRYEIFTIFRRRNLLRSCGCMVPYNHSYNSTNP